MAIRFRFRLSSILFLVVIVSVILAIYSTRRQVAREAWTNVEGIWELSTLTLGDEFYDPSQIDMYLRIQGLKVETLILNPRQVTDSEVVPRIQGIDLYTRHDTPLRALYQCNGDELLLYHTEDGELRPKHMPANVSNVGSKNVLMKFIRMPAGSIDFDETSLEDKSSDP